MAMSATPEWPDKPPADPARPDLELFGPASRFPSCPPAPGTQIASAVGPNPAPGLNTTAVVAFVLAFVVAPAAIVLSVIARGQIRRTGESGKGLATAGLALGIVFTVVGVVAGALLAGTMQKAPTALDSSLPAPDSTAPTVSGPPPLLSAADLSRALIEQLGSQGAELTDATCPWDLQGIPGQTVRCTVLHADGQPVDVIVTVNSVDGGSIDYDYRPEARPIAKSLLELKVSELIAQRTGTRPGATRCAGDLPPIVGQRIDCSVRTRGGTVTVTVATTGAEGGRISFSLAPK